MTILWFKMFGILGVKVKYEENIFMVSLDHKNLCYDSFNKSTEGALGETNISLFFIDGDRDKILVKDDISLAYCLTQWDMVSSLVFFAKKKKIYLGRKYIYQQSSLTALFR
ncbi:hypothetical protein MEL_272 [Melbournevirus]|uniref:hypothetical protein n=1 Tax=Melbournevirus TaxID=1560514 RepID=UPI00051F5B39|nr:hypothetical protein MEL_272 [Melbournevirus]AIT54885.1 transmembrane domain-containing protein [Melbournevirus]